MFKVDTCIYRNYGADLAYFLAFVLSLVTTN